jgi:hypothetical protein
MTDIFTTPANIHDLLDGYNVIPSSTTTHVRFARAVTPQPFACLTCGAEYHSEWVGMHVVKPRCPACTERIRNTRSAPVHVGYPMPPMYTRDGSALLPAIRAWLTRPLPALALLHGGPGRGKSAQAHHIGAWCHDRNVTFRMIGDRDLMRLSDDDMALCASASVLVIDEIGRRTTEGVIANVCELIDRRVPYDRKTAIVSNLTGQDLAMVDARLISRLKAADRIAFTGGDLRKPTMAAL